MFPCHATEINPQNPSDAVRKLTSVLSVNDRYPAIDMIKQQIRLNTVDTCVTVLNLSPNPSARPFRSRRAQRHTDPASAYADSRISEGNYDDRHTTYPQPSVIISFDGT